MSAATSTPLRHKTRLLGHLDLDALRIDPRPLYRRAYGVRETLVELSGRDIEPDPGRRA